MPVTELKEEISRVLRAMGVDGAVEIVLERPRNPEHGDFASNVAMTLARPLGRPPRQIAEELVGRLDLSGAGIRAATNEVLVLTDSDTSWEPGLLEAIQMPFADPRVGAVGTRQNV
ncbi:MAG: hypothetical protein KY464_17985, partial [Gemmatimonadetes bacterium]|nr:hypothetical protein [Gemmatimonadota bacterium]